MGAFLVLAEDLVLIRDRLGLFLGAALFQCLLLFLFGLLLGQLGLALLFFYRFVVLLRASFA